jgi:hypothetical protein
MTVILRNQVEGVVRSERSYGCPRLAGSPAFRAAQDTSRVDGRNCRTFGRTTSHVTEWMSVEKNGRIPRNYFSRQGHNECLLKVLLV